MDTAETQNDELSAALDEALGEDPSSSELGQMQTALAAKRVHLLNDLKIEDDLKQREKLQRMLKSVDAQIRVLAQEAGITRFVEDTVRLSMETSRLN